MRSELRNGLWLVTVLGWLLVIAGALPERLVEVSAGLMVLGASAGAAGVVVMAVMWCQRPIADVWQAGREYGRREAIRAQRPPDVTFLHEVRASRSAGSDKDCGLG